MDSNAIENIKKYLNLKKIIKNQDDKKIIEEVFNSIDKKGEIND